jgi:hypothetical protein
VRVANHLGDKIVTGRGDIFCAPEEADEPTPTDFNWDNYNRFDKVVKHLVENESRQFTVQSANAGDAGSLTLALSSGFKLDVFPQDSESGEHWRFFEPYSEKQHLVFSGTGFRPGST